MLVDFYICSLITLEIVTILILNYTITTFVAAENQNGNGKTTPIEKLKKKETLSRYGSFYLRLGAIGNSSDIFKWILHFFVYYSNIYISTFLAAFGIGSMVYSGLEFGEYFETTDRCRYFLSALTPALRMALTLAQMQFIFLTNKDIEAGSFKMIQRFGFMHLIATNLCEWLYVLVEETKHEIHHLEHSMTSKTNTSLQNLEESCRRSNIMGTLVQNASPFLFPCTIEYSLICAVILYEMWKEVWSNIIYI